MLLSSQSGPYISKFDSNTFCYVARIMFCLDRTERKWKISVHNICFCHFVLCEFSYSENKRTSFRYEFVLESQFFLNENEK